MFSLNTIQNEFYKIIEIIVGDKALWLNKACIDCRIVGETYSTLWKWLRKIHRQHTLTSESLNFTGNEKTVQVLLRAGGIADVTTRDGLTPLHKASYYGKIKKNLLF